MINGLVDGLASVCCIFWLYTELRCAGKIRAWARVCQMKPHPRAASEAHSTLVRPGLPRVVVEAGRGVQLMPLRCVYVGSRGWLAKNQVGIRE